MRIKPAYYDMILMCNKIAFVGFLKNELIWMDYTSLYILDSLKCNKIMIYLIQILLMLIFVESSLCHSFLLSFVLDTLLISGANLVGLTEIFFFFSFYNRRLVFNYWCYSFFFCFKNWFIWDKKVLLRSNEKYTFIRTKIYTFIKGFKCSIWVIEEKVWSNVHYLKKHIWTLLIMIYKYWYII